MAELELFRRYPQAASVPHVELATLPTPVEELDGLGAELGIDALWVKRDDQSAALYGGNKVRKLEFILGHVLAEERRALWTVGAVGSHHVLATSLYARQLGIEPHALHFPQPITNHVLEVLTALSTAKPNLTLISSKQALPIKMAQKHIKEWLSRSPDPYYVPGGGSSPRGVLGYVNAALELARQVDNGDLPAPDVIYVAAGTCGTLAGLVLGCKLAELPTRVIGVRVVDKVLANPIVTLTLANRTGRLLRDAGVEVPKIGVGDIEIIDDQFGSGYGEETTEGQTAIEVAEKFAGLELDPTYTAKAFAGLMAETDRAKRPPRNVLYWHTLSSADLTKLTEHADIDDGLPEAYREFFASEDVRI